MYPGGKNNSYQKIINLIPPHRVYIEAYAGSGAIMRYKKPARINIALDLNEPVLAATKKRILAEASLEMARMPGKYKFLVEDAISFLSSYSFDGDEFVYLDPPYLMETRKTKRPLYEFEYSDKQHEQLLQLIKTLDCNIMLSGYWSEMYTDYLSDWYTSSFESMTRGGTMATEWLWMNYPEPARLHDYQYLGDNFRERERIKRKGKRWVEGLLRLDVLEQRAILRAIEEAGLLR